MQARAADANHHTINISKYHHIYCTGCTALPACHLSCMSNKLIFLISSSVHTGTAGSRVWQPLFLLLLVGQHCCFIAMPAASCL
jgi:hypothetical protein